MRQVYKVVDQLGRDVTGGELFEHEFLGDDWIREYAFQNEILEVISILVVIKLPINI